LPDKPEQSRLLVPFGTKDWATNRIIVSKNVAGELVFECPVSHAILDIKTQQALRLNSDWYSYSERPPIGELKTAEARFNFIKNHMPIYCDIWDKSQKLFLNHYFNFILQHADKNQYILKNKLKGLNSLYSYQDWLMSAYLPLPQSIIYLPQDPQNQAYENKEMFRVPLLFWTGQRAIILFFIGSDTPSPRLTNMQTKLTVNGYNVYKIEQKRLIVGDDTWMEEFLMEHFGHFWEAEVLPSGPFKPKIADPIN
jgi:hypothetical protein